MPPVTRRMGVWPKSLNLQNVPRRTRVEDQAAVQADKALETVDGGVGLDDHENDSVRDLTDL